LRAFDSLREWYRARASAIEWRSRRVASSVRWHLARLRPELTCRIEDGAELTVPSRSQIARGLYEGFYEARERRFLRGFLRPGDVFYDIGANVGLYSVLAATMVGSKGAVYCFEPNEASLHFLRRNMARVACRTGVFGVALSDGTEEELELSVPAQGFDAWATLGSINTLDAVVTKRRVQASTLDAIQAQAGLAAPSAIKLDVEGWEARVLRGSASIWRSADPPMLMVELCDRASEGAGSSSQELLRLVEGFGLEVFELGRDRAAVVPLVRRERYPYVNVFAAKPGSTAWRRMREVPE
jgi:FkbM family methyltransferase